MNVNKFHFPPGMSIPEFLGGFGTAVGTARNNQSGLAVTSDNAGRPCAGHAKSSARWVLALLIHASGCRLPVNNHALDKQSIVVI